MNKNTTDNLDELFNEIVNTSKLVNILNLFDNNDLINESRKTIDLEQKVSILKKIQISINTNKKNYMDTLTGVNNKLQHLSQLKKFEESIFKFVNDYEKNIALISTPIRDLIPDVTENRRAIPNTFLRSALFGIVKKGKRAIVEGKKIFTMSNYDIWFSGSELDQNDLSVWDSLVYLANDKNIDDKLAITIYELCKILGYSRTKTAYNSIIKRAERLKFATVKVKHLQYTYIGSLIDEVYIDESNSGKLVVRFNKRLAILFSDNDYTLINIEIRRAIGEHQLARWIYHFYESHRDPIPFKIDFLKNLCRSESNIYKFKSMLKEALEIVKRAHLNIGRLFNYQITNNNILIISKNKSAKMGYI